MEFDSSTNEVVVKRSFSHAGEVRHLAPSPSDAELLVTCGKQRSQPAEAKLWRMPGGDGGENEVEEMVEVAAIPTQKAPVSK